MERIKNCDIIMDIEMIDNVLGGNRYFEVLLTAKDTTRYKIIFSRVWDLRWSVENASIMRWSHFRTCLPEGLIHNSVYVVEDSEYIKYFEHQITGTYPTHDITHYLLHDAIDSTLDVLAVNKPELVKIG